MTNDIEIEQQSKERGLRQAIARSKVIQFNDVYIYRENNIVDNKCWYWQYWSVEWDKGKLREVVMLISRMKQEKTKKSGSVDQSNDTRDN